MDNTISIEQINALIAKYKLRITKLEAVSGAFKDSDCEEWIDQLIDELKTVIDDLEATKH